MPVQFEVFVLVTLRIEGKASLTEVEVYIGTIAFVPAVLAPAVSVPPDFISSLLWMKPVESLQAM